MRSNITLRNVGLRRILYPAVFMTACAVFLFAQSANAFEDRFGESLDKDHVYNIRNRGDLVSLDRSGPSGMMGRRDRDGGPDLRDGDGDGGGFPGPGGRNSGPDNRRGPDSNDGPGGRGRGRGR
jgi:hypothetical protein